MRSIMDRQIRQAHPQTVGLCRVESLEDALKTFRINAQPRNRALRQAYYLPDFVLC